VLATAVVFVKRQFYSGMSTQLMEPRRRQANAARAGVMTSGWCRGDEAWWVWLRLWLTVRAGLKAKNWR